MSGNNDIMVSICCATYNHEKYIRQALDGFVKQKTNFKYEILIHDDASTDKTADIIREYEEKYPGLIKPIYQTENQYSKKVPVTWTYQYPRAKGKYIAFCEGDDFWCSDTKLQEQYDIMESYPNVVFCAHKVGLVTENGEDSGDTYPQESIGLSEGIITSEMFVKMLIGDNVYPFQTTSYFLRGQMFSKLLNEKPDFFLKQPVGDMALMWFFSINGDAYYIDKEYSKYRKGVPGSWSERQKKSKLFFADIHDKRIEAYEAFNLYTKEKYKKWIKRNIQYARISRIKVTGRIYSVAEFFEFFVWVIKRLVSKTIKILK